MPGTGNPASLPFKNEACGGPLPGDFALYMITFLTASARWFWELAVPIVASLPFKNEACGGPLPGVFAWKAA